MVARAVRPIRRAAGIALACAVAAPAAAARPGVPTQSDPRVEASAAAIATLLARLPAGEETDTDDDTDHDAVAVVAPAIRGSAGEWGDPEVAAAAVARAASLSGRPIALAAAEGPGRWIRPPGRVLLALGDLRIGPEAKLAWLEIEVTGDDGIARRLAFSLKHTERGWVALEWGPAESES